MSASPAEPPKIRIRGLKKAFGQHLVLNGVDLEIARGESLVVIGGSGSGKSVLLKCILGLLAPDEGSIQIDGQETVGLRGRELEDMRAHIGMLFQNSALFDSLAVWRNVAFVPLAQRLMSRKQARELALERLADVGLEAEVADLSPAGLSGGMRKRVALARAIAVQPEILFFDEPTTGLDPIMGDLIDRLIRKCVTDLGATGLTITHDMDSARRVSDRVAMLYQGRIVWEGPMDRIEAEGNAIVEQFVSGSTEGPIQVNP